MKALDGVSFEFRKGEIHAVCGENGAGKSTLMNIITGNIQPDQGTIVMNDHPTRIRDISHAQALGISIVYQEGSLSEAISVAENIFSNRQPVTRFGTINYKRLHKEARSLLDDLHIHDIDPAAAVSNLNAEQRKMVEIAKALSLYPSFLILDEPTASVSSSKAQDLFRTLRSLKEKGVTIVYISHRMDEIMQIADRISVLRDGVFQGTVDAKETTIQQVIRMMVGRDVNHYQVSGVLNSEIVFDVDCLCGQGFRDISFQIHKGEIFGMAGLQGAGRTALARTIFGDLRAESGNMRKSGIKYRPAEPADAMRAGIAYIPEDRKALGLFIENTIEENISVAHLKQGVYVREQYRSIARKYIADLNIRATGYTQTVRKLSGGNQQKVVLARWLSTNPDLLIINEPTHGVDIGAKSEIYQLLKKMTQDGKTILLISSDLPELLLLSNRIGVMYRGNLTRIFDAREASEELITAAASGL